MEYLFRDRAVLPATRSAVLDRWPILARDDQKAVSLRRFMQYVLFGAFRYGTAALIAPYRTVATLFATHPKTRGYKSIDCLKEFEDSILPLNITEHDRGEGQAREIRPEIPPEIVALKEQELNPDPEQRPERVYFVSGQPVSERQHRAMLREYQEKIHAESRVSRPDHPARDLLDCLNEQPLRTFRRVVTSNWEAVCGMAFAMPHDTLRERNRREAAFRVLEGVEEEEFRPPIYTPSENTLRIHAAGYNIHLLPREMRKVALAGGIALDLKACQLAVVAKLWHLPHLEDFLHQQQAGGLSIWEEFYTRLGVSPEAKQALKHGLYAATYGMGKRRIVQELADGTELEEGIGRAKARAFRDHPLIRDLLEARDDYYRMIRRKGGARDAFGAWISTGRYREHEIAAQQAQSYELRLMKAILPVLRTDGNISVLSWLHDGVTIKVHDHTKTMRKVRQLQRAVEREADTLGMYTYLEVET